MAEKISVRDALLLEVDEIIPMAQALMHDGHTATAVVFAMIAAERLRAVRAIDEMNAAMARPVHVTWPAQ